MLAAILKGIEIHGAKRVAEIVNLSERYVEESDLKELKAQYEKNKAHALEVIKAKKELDTHC